MTMDSDKLKTLLQDIAGGTVSVDDGIDRLRHLPFEDLGFARVDHHRGIRCGFPEVIYCPGKTVDQIVEIAGKLIDSGANVLATRAEEDVFQAVKSTTDLAQYNPMARTISIRQREAKLSTGSVGVVCAGTSDMPVGEEARETLVMMDQRVESFYDVGVAGLHRLLASRERLYEMNALVVVAGMEGALPSVVGGLVSAPVIAVPTSVGYGASFSGLSALLTMLNSCVPSISVVNIDNGFAAGYSAALINRLADKPE